MCEVGVSSSTIFGIAKAGLVEEGRRREPYELLVVEDQPAWPVERASLPDYQEDVAGKGRRHSTNGAQRDGSAWVGEIATQVGALHHANHRSEADTSRTHTQERKHVVSCGHRLVCRKQKASD